ncbi:MAG: hypothetical protein OQL06_00795 [Gammaproteobacteria bacterium]|nr:hypothetical protein [Gammaproteobacteria bacterium]
MTIGDEPEEVQKEYLKIAGSYSAPIFWADSNNVLSNGTAFVLNTGEHTFVVTAAHVYESYIEAKEEGKATNCQLSNIDFYLEERRISDKTSESMDIATFSITEEEIKSLNICVLHGSQETWPPTRPNEGEAIVVAGYPGIERIEEKKQEYNFGLHCFNTPASSISERHIGCSFERQYWVDIFGNGLPEKLYNLGGISGAPAITLEKSESGIVSWRLVGVVYQAEASETLGEILLIHHAGYINPDGTVRDYT